MRKTLYIIGGPMGVGKTTAAQRLKTMLPDCAFLDGDWCWDMHPFRVTEETKAMVLNNICYMLNGFLACSAYRNIVFCWVLHEQSILDVILGRLAPGPYEIRWVSLVCRPEVLEQRLKRDIAAGKREADVVRRALDRLPLYVDLPAETIDVSDLTPEETAKRICAPRG